MEAGDGDDVHEPRLLQVADRVLLQPLPLPGEEGGDEAGGRLVKEGGDLVFQPGGQALGQIPQGAGPALGDRLRPLVVQPGKDAPGGVVGARLPAHLQGAVVPDRGRDPLPRLQVQEGGVPVVDRLAHEAAVDQTDGGPGAVVRLLRPVRQLHRDGLLRPHPGLRRGEEQGGVGGKPQDPRRQAEGQQADDPPPLPPQVGKAQTQEQRRRPGPGPPRRRQKVLAQPRAAGKGQGEPHQLPHGPYSSSRMPSSRRACRALWKAASSGQDRVWRWIPSVSSDRGRASDWRLRERNWPTS